MAAGEMSIHREEGRGGPRQRGDRRGDFLLCSVWGGVGMGGPVEGRNKQAGGMKGDGSHGSV